MINDSIKYTILESGIHYFIFLNNSREAAETYINLSGEILRDSNQGSADHEITIRILTDFTETLLPELEHMVVASIDSRQRHVKQYDYITLRIAYLTDDDNIKNLMNHVGGLVNLTSQRNYFKSSAKQEALEWLLIDE